MKRLLILFTGGTIGSKKQGAGIHVDGAGSYALIDAYRSSSYFREEVQLDTLQPLNILSENMTPDDWQTLAAALRGVDPASYDGIVVTHGSDTLAYSAAMLSYLFANTSLPIVLTASNYPLADERSNGRRNFANAIDFAADSAIPGVFVVYENDQGEALVYLGTRITQAVSFTDQFGSPYGAAYGKMDNRQFVWLAHERNPSPDTLRARVAQQLSWSPTTLVIDSGIVYIKPYPGLNYTYYDFRTHKPKAILHDLHHSGTACAAETPAYSLTAFIQSCQAQGIDFYICPIRDRSDALYSSSLKLIEAGAIVIENMSIEAAITKLMLAYGLFATGAEAEAFVTGTDLFYECNKVQPKI